MGLELYKLLHFSFINNWNVILVINYHISAILISVIELLA